MEDPLGLPSFAFLGGNEEEGMRGAWEIVARDREWLKPVHEISVADWLVERCRRWPSPPYDLTHFPAGFDACARLLHPAKLLTESRDHLPVRWSEVASWNGYTVDALTQFHEITNVYRWNGMDLGSRPKEGELPDAELKILAQLLQGFTLSPNLYYFGFWDGYGHAAFDPGLRSLPKFGISDRCYYLFSGNLDPAPAGKAFHFMPPTYWWPADRAWCVYTDIDATDTFIGGSAACIEAVLNHPELEALPITLEARVYGDGDAP